MNIALVGIGGYGHAYIEFFQKELPSSCRLMAAVEPYPELSPAAVAWLKESGIPLYPDLDSLYASQMPELVILSTPIPLHKKQAIFCMEHGSHVLCEKPLVPSLADAKELKEAQQRTGKKLGVGFQWSFSDTMLGLKKDLMDGVLGRPLLFKTHISWCRPESYYTGSSWKGRIRNEAGDLVNDSILTNATAHYLHNVFFINGPAMDLAARPIRLSGCLGRTYPIETYDTCFIRGTLENGCEFLHIATHSAETNSEPKLEYRFENACVYYDSNLDPTLYAVFKDGSRKEYGKPLSLHETSQKVSRMTEAVENDTVPCCHIQTVLPHLVATAAIQEQLPVLSYPEADLCLRFRDNGWYHYTRHLYEETVRCYEEECLPSRETAVSLTSADWQI